MARPAVFSTRHHLQQLVRRAVLPTSFVKPFILPSTFPHTFVSVPVIFTLLLRHTSSRPQIPLSPLPHQMTHALSAQSGHSTEYGSPLTCLQSCQTSGSSSTLDAHPLPQITQPILDAVPPNSPPPLHPFSKWWSSIRTGACVSTSTTPCYVLRKDE